MTEPRTETRYVHAGTEGRLIRALMQIARDTPDWQAIGPVERYAGDRGRTVLRQRIARLAPRAPEEIDHG